SRRRFFLPSLASDRDSLYDLIFTIAHHTEVSVNRKIFALSTVVVLAARATTKSNVTMAGNAMAVPDMSTSAPQPDRRIGLKSGLFNAAEASWNLHLASTTQPTTGFINRNDPG